MKERLHVNRSSCNNHRRDCRRIPSEAVISTDTAGFGCYTSASWMQCRKSSACAGEAVPHTSHRTVSWKGALPMTRTACWSTMYLPATTCTGRSVSAQVRVSQHILHGVAWHLVAGLRSRACVASRGEPQQPSPAAAWSCQCRWRRSAGTCCRAAAPATHPQWRAGSWGRRTTSG